MRAERIAGCEDTDCPKIYFTTTGTVLAQGNPVTNVEGVTPGPGELVVELPEQVLRLAVAELDLRQGRV
ncbi:MULTISPECIES: hypothetical protein [unclassified Crossiella]|uniref:hypothetical protein n=1 Tax=unclassified Crossiella TaxID=2620835 RepID=UPI00200030F8|nr:MULTISPECIES: hypothetical protein [unclassified Crossiella]MCK2241234.1 hypothetical protein [Crossiella sp. S99.2]MCK2253622.1 hypothetical protein [Crossiella sp. S99.1]